MTALPQNPYPPADWETWAHMLEATVRQAVLLSLDLDPSPQTWTLYSRELTVHNFRPSLGLAFRRRLAIALDRVRAEGPLRPVGSVLRGNADTILHLAEFGAWATSMEWSLPDRFPKAKLADPAFSNEAGWPWGSHETTLLRQLAAAAEKFWSLYDPAEPSTAPTNRQVEVWLMGHGVTKRTAEVMATILRAEKLPPGPRK